MGDRAMQSTQIIFPALTKDDFLAQERERVSKRVTMTVMSANVLRWLGGLSTIPDELLAAGRAVLAQAQQDGAIRDYRLYALGSDLVMQLMTLGQGLHNAKVGALASAMVTAALTRAADAHVYHPLDEGDFFHLTPRQRLAALRLRPLEFPLTFAMMMGSAPRSVKGNSKGRRRSAARRWRGVRWKKSPSARG